MDPRSLGKLIAAGRLALGIVLVAQPARVTVRWLGTDGGLPAVAVVARGLGARDIALGAGALLSPQESLRPWFAAAALADAADFGATLAAGSALPLLSRALVAATALAGTAGGVVAASGS